ncbi:GNAT family N-acetyltransferase [Alteribacter aurantiacus]|uniref:GNAT family N-acetyltransferase n=1 Tax=Alteribacter aurantiacus TaxID=254410 RepID=UPI00041D9D88|nr:GNAT family protein [Alteribacter aurantiacus]
MIRLDYFTEEDFDTLIQHVNGTSPSFFMQWSGPTFTFPLSREQLLTYIEGANNPESKNHIYKLTLLKTNNTVGHLAIRNIDHFHGGARLGKVLIFPEYRGKGYGKIAIRRAITIAFEELNIHRLALGVFSFNKLAFQLYKETGFHEEGYFRDFRRVGDQYWDMYEMSMLKTDYERLSK